MATPTSSREHPRVRIRGSALTLAAVCFVMQSFRNVAAGREKGFLASGQDRETKLWNDFEESEERLRHSEREHKSAAAEAQPDQGARITKRVWGRLMDNLRTGKIWVDRPPPPGEPMLVNYSMQMTPPSKSPCEQRISDSRLNTNQCQATLKKLELEIVAAAAELEHLTNDHPLLNTLAIRREVHHNSQPRLDKYTVSPHNKKKGVYVYTPDVPTGLAPSGLDVFNGTWVPIVPISPQLGGYGMSSRLTRAMKMHDQVEAGLDKLRDSPEWIDPPAPHPSTLSSKSQALRLGHGLDFEKVSIDIAQHIAAAQPQNVTQNLAETANQTCTHGEAILLDDSQSLENCCMDSMHHKEQTLKRFKGEVRKRKADYDRY